MELDERLSHIEDRLHEMEIIRREQSNIYLPIFTQMQGDVGVLKHEVTKLSGQINNGLMDRQKSIESKLFWLFTTLVATLIVAVTNLLSRL